LRITEVANITAWMPVSDHSSHQRHSSYVQDEPKKWPSLVFEEIMLFVYMYGNETCFCWLWV